MLVINLNNNQSKKKSWMQEDQWMWHIVHTDTFAITDGACSGNPGKGGWRAVLINEGNEIYLSGFGAN